MRLRSSIAGLLSTYRVGKDSISLKLDLVQANFDMDTSIPLGIIINELVSNALNHAFPAGEEGEIYIGLHRTEKPALKKGYDDMYTDCETDFDYFLIVADNGKGIPESLDFKNVESLGFQLVNIPVDQIDGCIKL